MPPTQSRGYSTQPAALGHLGPLNPQSSQAKATLACLPHLACQHGPRAFPARRSGSAPTRAVQPRGAARDRVWSPGRRFPGTREEQEPAGPAGRPEPTAPPSRARLPTARPSRTHRPPEPARQAVGAETRHPATPAGSGLERSTAQRSAAPRARASRASRRPPPAGGWRVDVRRPHARARLQTRAKRVPGTARRLSAMGSQAPAAGPERPCLEILSALAAGGCEHIWKVLSCTAQGRQQRDVLNACKFYPRQALGIHGLATERAVQRCN